VREVKGKLHFQRKKTSGRNSFTSRFRHNLRSLSVASDRFRFTKSIILCFAPSQSFECLDVYCLRTDQDHFAISNGFLKGRTQKYENLDQVNGRAFPQVIGASLKT
jgi:hypothetical protein